MKNLRKSSYLISTKLDDGKSMLIHGYTGAIDIISNKLSAYLETHNEFLSADFPFEQDVFNVMEKRGYFTHKTKEEEHAYVAKVAGLLHEAHKRMYKNFAFVVTYNCNFRCPYCFENSISDQGKAWSRQVFTKETVDRAYAVMSEIEPRRELHTNTILLYGREPFLKENKDIVSYIVNKGCEYGYKFIAVTNGYDLEAYANLLSPERIIALQITLDGYRDYHNARRRHYEADGTFDKIIENISLALSQGTRVSVRINTDANNFEDVERLSEVFKRLGYRENSLFRFHSAVLKKYDNTDDTDIIYQSQAQHVEQHYLQDKEETACQDFDLYHKLCECLCKKMSLNIMSASCSSQYASYMFDPQGDIYTCWETIGKQGHCIGHYLDNPITWTPARQYWFDRHVGNAPNCRYCKYALLCSGGCLARASFFKKGFRKSVCCDYSTILHKAVQKAYKTFTV